MGHSRKKLNLTGQRFGKLIVLAPAENIGSRTAWRCRCDCGQEAIVTTMRLRDGHRTSCGCDREHFGAPPAEIGAGQPDLCGWYLRRDDPGRNGALQ